MEGALSASEDSTAQLIAALAAPDSTVRAEAAHSLGQTGDAQAVEPLIGALGDTHISVRLAAAEALGQLGNPRAVQSLLHILRSPGGEAGSTTLDQIAGLALGALGAGAVMPLIAALADPGESTLV